MITSVVISIFEGIGGAYFACAAVILLFCALPWVVVMREIKNTITKRIIVSLFVSLALAPSIYGFDLGAVTLPAVFIIFLSLVAELKLIVLIWSLLSIIIFWSAVFGAWTFAGLFFKHAHANDKA